MVSYNGKVTMGAGHPAHNAGLMQAEPYAPCVTRKMTPEERAFYGVDSKKGAKKKMKKKRGPRINIEKLKEMVEQGYTAANIAVELETTEEIVWERAKARGLITMLRANEEEEEVVAAEPDPEEEEEMDEPEAETVEPEYPQDSEENEYRFLSPEWIDAIARGLTKGAVKHPGETWRTIPAREHAWRAVRHLILYLKGDTKDTHLINASMRCMMAFVTAAAEQNRETWEKRMSEKGCG